MLEVNDLIGGSFLSELLEARSDRPVRTASAMVLLCLMWESVLEGIPPKLFQCMQRPTYSLNECSWYLAHPGTSRAFGLPEIAALILASELAVHMGGRGSSHFGGNALNVPGWDDRGSPRFDGLNRKAFQTSDRGRSMVCFNKEE